MDSQYVDVVPVGNDDVVDQLLGVEEHAKLEVKRCQRERQHVDDASLTLVRQYTCVLSMLESLSSRREPKCTFEGARRCCSLDSIIPRRQRECFFHFPSLRRHTKDDTGSRSARNLAGLADQRQQEIDGVKVTEAVDTKMSINAISVEACVKVLVNEPVNIRLSVPVWFALIPAEQMS